MGSASKQQWYNLFEQSSVQQNYVLNEVIDFQGQQTDYVGVVKSGRIDAVVFSENGHEVWIGDFAAGDFIGHMSFLKDVPSHFELIAQSDVSLLRVTTDKMRQLIDEDKGLREAFTADFAKRLEAMTVSVVGAYTLSARGRVCAELIRLSREIGIDPDKHIIRPNPIYVDLARRVNSTRETVSRTVSDLEKAGVLTREPGALIVQSPQKLSKAFK